MREFVWAGIAAVVVASGFLGTTVTTQGRPSDVAICHVPPGNPGNVHPITVGLEAAARHLSLHDDFDNLDGSWSGPFVQGTVDSYLIDVEFVNTCSTPGSVIASVDYPAFPDCSGTWTLESADSTRLVVVEAIGSGCISGCRYSLEFHPGAGTINLLGEPSAACVGGGDPTTWSAVLSRTP
jgi:hypothetical protein